MKPLGEALDDSPPPTRTAIPDYTVLLTDPHIGVPVLGALRCRPGNIHFEEFW